MVFFSENVKENVIKRKRKKEKYDKIKNVINKKRLLMKWNNCLSLDWFPSACTYFKVEITSATLHFNPDVHIRLPSSISCKCK